jgi:hypothetical protein
VELLTEEFFMALEIDTLGLSLPTEIRSAFNESSPLFKQDCVVSLLDDQTTDTWQLKVRTERYTRVLNLDPGHQTVLDIQLALQKVQASFTDHCHSCFHSAYLLKCAGNATKTCEDWVCPEHNEMTLDHPRCPGCYVQPFDGPFAGLIQ